MNGRGKVAFQGARGAFSHLACRAARPDHEVLPCKSFDAAFDAVEAGEAELAMLPVENSQAGRVRDIHRLLPERQLHIVGEHFQPVHHQLLGPPGAVLIDVREVQSHPQALAQCRLYLQAQKLQPVAVQDTAWAAYRVAEQGDPSIAAVASTLAAEMYGLDVLAADIEDAHDNTTRFLIMSRTPAAFDEADPELITSCVFQVGNIPAALYKALGGFATNGINLLKLESYQLARFQWARFAIDFQGHPNSPAVRRALDELSYFTDDLRILGTYPADDFRGTGVEKKAL